MVDTTSSGKTVSGKPVASAQTVYGCLHKNTGKSIVDTITGLSICNQYEVSQALLILEDPIWWR